MSKRRAELFEAVIIGGGQAGLTAGYYLAKHNRPFVILDANERVGDAWRKRWDSLRLFTPASFNGLPGLPLAAPAWSFPTKDEMADYLEAYAARFELPVRTGINVDRLAKAEAPSLRARARSRDRPAALLRISEPLAAAGGGRPPGRRR
jgi:putative flavoprotein involved in K+ transport